jgi:hypothetical protein
MLDNGFEPEYSLLVQQQLVDLKAHSPQVALSANIRDLRYLLWSSIDNDTSRDLDQAEVAECLPNGETKVLVGIADVDSFVPKGSAIDEHAAKETTTVYTGVRNFSMLPEQLSTGTGLYAIGFAIVIGGLIHGAYLVHMPARWIVVGAAVLLGFGILTGVKATRQKDPVG